MATAIYLEMVQVLNHAGEQGVFSHDNGHVWYRFREPRSSGVWNDKNVHDTITYYYRNL